MPADSTPTVSAESIIRRLSLDNLQRFFLYGMLFSICLFRLGRVMVGGNPAIAPVKIFFALALLTWIANTLISRDTAGILRL